MKRRGKYQYAVLSWDKAIEKVYEYIISNTEDFFGIKNSDYLSMYIQEIDEQLGLILCLYNDYSIPFKFPISDEILEDLPWTGMKYEKYIVSTDSKRGVYCKGRPVLNEGEIRYLKLNLDNIKDILATIMHELLQIVYKNNHNKYMNVVLNDKKEFIFTISEEYCDNSLISSEELEDITALIINKFV